MKLVLSLLGAAALSAYGASAVGKPIAFARGTTYMVERGAGTMNEAQIFYAPKYWWSAGGGWLELESDDGTKHRHITYGRVNLLAKRWNLPRAQANVFVWGGLGRAIGNDVEGRTTPQNAGAQRD